MIDKPFNIIRAEYPELLGWLKSISRGGNIDLFVIPDYKNREGVDVTFFTKVHSYHIGAVKPGERDAKRFEGREDKGYLGCIAQCRKPRAGEEWTRGNDLPDGSYSEETWHRIVNAIIGYELVKVVKLPKEKNLDI